MISEPEVQPSASNRVVEERIKVAIHSEYPEQTIAIGFTLLEGGRKELCDLLRCTLDIFAWKPADMTGVPRHVAKHRLNVREGCPPVRQKKRRSKHRRNKAIHERGRKTCGSRHHEGSSLSQLAVKSDNAFQKQIGRNLEVYVDDLVIKSRTEQEIIRDIEETFKTLREINMKLNPKKCTFGVEEGMFLGYMVNTKGIKVCPDKVEAVLSLPSPKCLKDVQRLNGKLANLNRFLAKSAKKSLPFYKTLKKCTKKSDFQWTTNADTGIQNRERELKSNNGATHTNRTYGKGRTYCITCGGKRSRQEINYTPTEKVVLALVHASKRLKRYFQAYPIVIITDQPIKQVISKPEIAGRSQKWSIELGEYDIQYRPRVSIKGQILADFIVERPEDDSLAAPMEVEEDLLNRRHCS
ncbi:reverse transcriptase domain-containing protein [Tanacetum coccineum]|uniref:Reverse transcriptase domain-containing protein n=1 Tax=Tanacetum coccineum TaxID=301880 RepID=A0ABQ4X178_9ASTR